MSTPSTRDSLAETATAARDSLAETAGGAFVRTASTVRHFIRDEPGAEFPAEAGRYLLYVSSRVLALLALKGLTNAIEVAVVAPIWGATKPGVDEHRGWVFDPAVPGATATSGWAWRPPSSPCRCWWTRSSAAR